jgi:hypothetical protein
MSMTGVYGAKVQSWAEHNPRELLKKVADANPGASQDGLLAILTKEAKAKKNGDYLDAMIAYWFANNYHAMMQARPMAAPRERAAALETRRAQRETVVKQGTEALREHIKREAQIILLDMVTPNGRALRDCTAEDCRAYGGWFLGVAAATPSNCTVGQALDEQRLQEIYSSQGG